MKTLTRQILLAAAGVVCFVVAALASFGWLPGDMDVDVLGVALVGFACWLASTIP